MPRTIIVEPGQCMEDIALMEYGSINGVAWLLVDNEDVFTDGFSTDLPAGSKLSIRDQAFDQPVYAAARRASIVPATNADDDGPDIGPGGDYNGDYNDDHSIT